MRQSLTDMGRIYRKVSYGPLLDVFLLDMRSYRGGNDHTSDPAWSQACAILGAAQLEWLKRELAASNATWKVIAADLPLSIVSADAVAQGDGRMLGREFEIADLLAFIKHAGVRNTVWITADMHYTAAHRYDPNRAVFQDFEPFWEFVSGPLHAGTWGPGELDSTFGPVVMYQNGCSAAQGENLAPCLGLQFFGHVAIDGDTEVMTVTLKDVGGRDLWSTRIEPKLLRWTRGTAVQRI
jgi:alkaline phosphatase D